MRENIGKNISKYLSSKYSQNFLIMLKKSALNALKIQIQNYEKKTTYTSPERIQQ